MLYCVDICFFFFNDTATTDIYTLSLHDALPICSGTTRAAARHNHNRAIIPHNRCMTISSINPATGETLQVFDPLSAEVLEQQLAHSFATFQISRKTSFAERPQWLSNAARVLEDSKQEYGRIMTVEMGKTLKSAVAEAEKCASACRYYAENGERYLADEAIATNASRSFVRYQPIGPVLAVMPWNFPFWQVFRFAAPA